MRARARVLPPLLAALALLLGTGAASGCGDDSDCGIPGGSYRILLPGGSAGEGLLPAIMYFHGYRGSARGVMRNKGLAALARSLGVALIAPQGAGGTWSYPGSPSSLRDEFAFVDAVLSDVVERHAVDPERILATGFSMGGSMVWYLACHRGERFKGFAPVAGAFWEPLPPHCPSPMPRMIHVHGLDDRVVPYEGRPIRDRFRQGHAARSIDVWLTQARCEARAPMREAIVLSGAPLDCSRRFDCGGGSIELCLHDGGHSIRPEWIRRAWEAFER